MFHIIVRDNCQWCDKAKALLTERGLPFKTYNLGEGETDFRLFVRALYRTVPQIWDTTKPTGYRFVGDYNSLVDYLATTD